MKNDLAPMRAPSMFDHVYPLPSAEKQAATRNRHRQLNRQHRGAGVGRHVVGTLVVVALWMYWFPALRERKQLASETQTEAV